MADTKPHAFPTPSVQRLPVYLRFLKEALAGGERVISCTRIAEEFSQLSVQVRKDLAMTGVTGRPKVGYKIVELIDAIEAFLGWNQKTTAVLIGAGSLGSAILGYQGFKEHGLRVLAAFDANRAKAGTKIHDCPIYPIEELPIRAKRASVQVGILTVPAAVAQSCADQLLQIGVRGIWNYTPCRLILPPDIVCEDVKLSASFAILSRRLMDQR